MAEKILHLKFDWRVAQITWVTSLTFPNLSIPYLSFAQIIINGNLSECYLKRVEILFKLFEMQRLALTKGVRAIYSIENE